MEQVKPNTKMENVFKQLMYPLLIAILAYFIKFQFELMTAKIDNLTELVQKQAVENSKLEGRLYYLEKKDEQNSRQHEAAGGWGDKEYLKPDEIEIKRRKP
jgi:hypothetical protein